MTNVLSNRREAERFARLHMGFERCLIAEQSGAVLAMLTWGPRESPRAGLARVTGILVNERVRRKGLGTLLALLALEDMQAYFSARRLSLRRVVVHAEQEDLPMRRMVEKLGFAVAAQIKDHTGPGSATVIYALTAGAGDPCPRIAPPRPAEKGGGPAPRRPA
jgi:ribosomal protein S18 acetylase RimI-like enzyme